ncbi:MAG TPA: PAS domain S-box protein [Planctomycetota bacterium]|jgi:PAS domain S-box-containing protein
MPLDIRSAPALFSRPFARYGLAVLTVILAAVFRWLLRDLFGQRLAFVSFSPAVALAALLAGCGPGIVATVLSVLLADYLFIAPVGFGIAASGDIIGTVMFTVAGIFISLTAGLRERAQKRETVVLARLQAQEEITREREWLRVTLASIGDAVIATDHEGRVTLLNPVAEQATGWKNADAVGQPLEKVFNIINEDTRLVAANPVARVLREGVIVGLANHTNLVHKDGHECPIEDSAAPIRDTAGNTLGVVMVFHDVTEKRRAAVELRLLSQALESAANAVVITDRQGRIKWVNPAFTKLTGYTREEALGQNPRVLKSGETRPEIYRDLWETILRGDTWHGELINRRKDGTSYTEEMTIAPVRATGRDVTHFVAVKEDVTERRRAEEALRQSESRLTEIIQRAPSFMAVMRGPDHIFELANNHYYEVVGRHDILGKKLVEALPEIAGTPYPQILDRVRQTGEPFIANDVSVMLARGAGGAMEEAWLDFVIQPLREPDGTIQRIFAHGVDLTERKLAEQALRRTADELAAASRRKDEFLAVVSHELRTPLTPILGWTQILRNTKADEKLLERGLDTINRNVRAQIRLVEDLLDVSRIVSGKVQIQLAPVGLAQVIEGAMEAVRTMAEGKQIHMKFVMEESVGPVLGDADRLQQIVWNLLSNAIKFNHDGGKVEIRLRRVGCEAELRVTDTGEGIDPAFVPNMFKRFSQSDSTYTRRHGGLGLGLSIVHELVLLHGGNVSVESKGRGEGSTFVVRLPATASSITVSSAVAQQAALEQAPYNTGLLKGKRLLIVDDDKDTLEYLATLLQSMGAELIMAMSAKEALQKAAERPPDILITDIGMPDTDGYELLREMRRQGIQVPAIALTAFARAEDRKRALDEGFLRHFAKPCNPGELCRALNEILQAV